MHYAVALIPLFVLSACGGKAIDDTIGSGRIVTTVGPGGKVLRGDGNAGLQGLVLEIPPGALDRLVQMTIEPGPSIEAPQTMPAAQGLSIRTEPGGILLRTPAILRMNVELAATRSPADLLVVQQHNLASPPGIGPRKRITIGATGGTYEKKLTRFSASISSLADLQVRLSTVPRLTEDASRLMLAGYAALGRGSDAGLREADQLLQEAQRADPFHPGANLFRAISRTLLVLNDRTDDGPGLDSLGEALAASGFPLRDRSLWERVVAQDWPARITVPGTAPRADAWLELLAGRIRPALQLALEDLLQVPVDTTAVLTLPGIPGLPSGERELDTADLLLLRSGLSATMGWIDLLSAVNLDVDPGLPFSQAGRTMPVTEWLSSLPNLFRTRARLPDQTLPTLADSLIDLVAGYEALLAETDPQGNDLFVLARSFGPARQDRWRQNLSALSDSLLHPGARTIQLESGRGPLEVDLLALLTTGLLDLRVILPAFEGNTPLAGSLPDPTMSGFLPGLTQEAATDLFGLVNRHVLPAAQITLDGAFEDWPAEAEALLPRDPLGDVRGAPMRGLDLWRMFLARSGEHLALRFTTSDGPIQHQPRQSKFYRFRFSPVTPGSPGEQTLDIRPITGGFKLMLTREGVVVDCFARIVAAGAEAELLLPLRDLVPSGAAPRDWVVTLIAHGTDLDTVTAGSDRTRGVIVRF